MEQFSQACDALHQHCADVGRDPAQILLSCQVQFTGDPSQTAAAGAAFCTAGADLAIVYLPLPHTPAMLDSLAPARSRGTWLNIPAG